MRGKDKMKKTNVIKKTVICLVTCIIALGFAFVFSKSVLADGELITWVDISNNTIIVAEDLDDFTVRGQLDPSVTEIRYSDEQYTAEDNYAGLSEGTFGEAVTINKDEENNYIFSKIIKIGKLDANGKNVYFYVKNQTGWIESSLTFKKLKQATIIPAMTEYYYNGDTLTIEGTITGNTDADAVVISSDTGKEIYDNHSKSENSNIALEGEDRRFSITISGNQWVDTSKEYALYAVDNETRYIVGKKTITLYRTPSLKMNGSNPIWVDLSNYNGTVTISNIEVAGYATGTEIGYTLSNFDRSETDDATIIDNLHNKKPVNSGNGNSIVASLDSLTLDGTPVYIYLYKNSTIYDVKCITIKRNSLSVDNTFKLYDSNSYQNETGEFTLLAKNASLSTYFRISGIQEAYAQSSNSSRDHNPYRVIIVETETGSKVAESDEFWIRSGNEGNYTYTNDVNITDLDDFPIKGKDYTAYLLYVVNDSNNQPLSIDIGKSIPFTIKNEIPQMTWEYEDIRTNNQITLPIYDTTSVTAQISGYKDGDVVAFTTDSLEEDELSGWADGITSTYSIGEDNKVEFPVKDLPLSDNNCYFYLIRNKDNEEKETYVQPLGYYPVKYKEITHNFGILRYNLPYDNKIYNIDNSDYYFFGPLQDSESHYITGYITNGLETDEFAWTSSELTEAELLEWNANEKIIQIEKDYSTAPYSSDRYYYYSIPLDEMTIEEDSPLNVHIYFRRYLGGGDYQIINLGNVIVKKAHNPELTVINSKETYSFSYNNEVYKNIDISLTANDVDTGVKEITVSYKQGGETKFKQLYFIGNDNDYAPNQSVSKDLSLYWIKNDEDKDIKIIIKNFSGRETIYEGLFATKPELLVKPVNKLESFEKNDYYTSSTRSESFEIIAKRNESTSSSQDDKAEIEKLIVEVNGITIIDNDYSKENKSQINEKINLADNRIPDSTDNKYNIHVKVTNKLSNVAENSFVLEVDKDRPEITGFTVNGKEMSSKADTGKYTYISNQRMETLIKAIDQGAGGLKEIKYYWEEINGNKTQEISQKCEENHPANANVKTSKDSAFKGYLFASAEDMVGNKPDNYATFGGIIIEPVDKHNAENHIDISAPDSGVKDSKGNSLYKGATSFAIRVSDNYSGIKSVEWRVSAPFDESMNKSGTLNINEGNLSDGSWSKNGSEKNIVTAVSKTISIDGNSDDCVLYVRMVDNAGNASERSVSFSIDKVKPTISVTYGNQTGDPDFNNFYVDNRTATIVIKERNFNQNSANAIISNLTGNKGTISGWTEKRDVNNPDNSTYTATVTFEKDDRYNLTYQCADRAGNLADAVTTPEFVIDKTVPVVTVTFDNGNGRNRYYANERKATVSVKDVNFEPSRVSISGVSPQSYSLSNWTRNNDTFSALITFNTDGVFAFDISARDKAGNQGNSVHENSFTIDLIKPEITIEGVADKSANNGTVAPKITFKDTNIDKNSISIELRGAINGRVDLTDKYTVSEDGLVFSFKNIENIKENDDLYTLRVSVKDLAGNVTTDEIKFSVNRFGSIYILGDNLKNINDKYVKTVNGINLTEINVNKIKKGSVVITLTINGIPNTLVEGKDYKIEVEESEGDWNQYKYKFEDSLFVKDGSYILAVVSEDEAGNKNNNGNETKEAEVKFGVDATAPIIAPVNFEANKYYDENGMEFSISVKDNMILDSVTVYIDGQPVTCTQDGEIYTFHINESNRRQEVKVVAKDLAGNETTESYEGILIAGNFIVRFFHNTLAIIISSAIGGILVIGGGILLALRLFRKRL